MKALPLLLGALLAVAALPALAAADTLAETRVSRALTGVVSASLAESGSFEVLTAADLRGVLSLDAQRQLAGCVDDHCVPELGHALGTRYAIFGRLDRAGDVLILNLSLVDTENARVVRRASVTGADEAALVESARTAVDGISAALEELGADRVLVLDVAAPLEDPPPPLLAVVGVATATTGLGGLGLTYLATAAFTALVMNNIRVPETLPLAWNFVPIVGAFIGPFASPRDYGDMLFLGLGAVQVLTAIVAASGGALWLWAPDAE